MLVDDKTVTRIIDGSSDILRVRKGLEKVRSVLNRGWIEDDGKCASNGKGCDRSGIGKAQE